MDKETQAKLEGIAVAAGLAAIVAILQYLRDNLSILFPGAEWVPVAVVGIAAMLTAVSQNQRWLNTSSTTTPTPPAAPTTDKPKA